MTTDDARSIALETQEQMRSLNATHEHPDSLKRGRLAGIILDLCDQLDARDRIAPTPPPPPEIVTNSKKGKK